MTTKFAALSYVSKVDETSLRTVELSTRDNNGNKLKEYCPVFDGKGGLEGLLYVEEEFDSVVDSLGLTTGAEKFDKYRKILSHTALQKWKTIVSDEGATGHGRTAARFIRCKDLLRQRYSGNQHDARDVMIKYLTSTECSKPKSVSTIDHVDRLETLIRYTNKLKGTAAYPTISDSKSKDIIFSSFPERWRQHYHDLERNIADDDIEDIILFMDNRKLSSDKKETDKRKRDSDKKSDKQQNKKNKGNLSHGPQSKCRKHPNGSHTWYECSLNPRGPNYRRPNGIQFGGRGRGFGGRENYGGRGRGGRGNGMHHDDRSMISDMSRSTHHSYASHPPPLSWVSHTPTNQSYHLQTGMPIMPMQSYLNSGALPPPPNNDRVDPITGQPY